MIDNSEFRLLIVDDTVENIQVLGAQLRTENYTINVAQNGQQALDAVALVRPDLILMDVMMPVMNGFDACRALKADPDTADIPVIFLTAKIEPEDIVEGLSIGGVDYVAKPFNAAELLQRVKTHLMIRHLQVTLEARVEELDQAAKTIARMARENESFLRHELNNAISPVLGYADMLIKNGKQNVEKRTKWAERIKSSAESMHDLLNALRDLQALERGAHELKKSAVDLEVLLLEEISNQELAESAEIKIKFDSSCESAIVMADNSFLPGIFRNLLKNAVEHVGGLPQDDHNLFVTLEDSEDMVTVVVANGGTPIAEERIPTFFEKFNSSKVSAGGAGLGTSYAWVVVSAHGGTIQVASSETGTTVTVVLPKA